jgi:hypothetical protein
MKKRELKDVWMVWCFDPMGWREFLANGVVYRSRAEAEKTARAAIESGLIVNVEMVPLW